MNSLFKTIISLFIGIILGYNLVSNFGNYYPNDFSRIKVILESLKIEECEVVLLGNSVLMNGVDANRFSENTYNLGSSGKGLNESFLMYQEIPKSVKHVIQFVSVDELLEEKLKPIDKQVILNYYSKGYSPNQFTLSLLDSASGEEFDNIEFMDNFRFQRIKFQGSINSFFRSVFQLNNLSNEKFKEIKNPFIYTDDLEESIVDELIKIHGPKTEIIDFKFNQLHFFLKSILYFKNRGVSYSIVVLPLHPKIKYTPNFQNNLNDFIAQNPDLKIYNFSQLLVEKDFIDHAHPNARGREKMTHELQKIID